MKPRFVHGQSGAHRFHRQRSTSSRLLTFMLASLAARGLLVQSALAQYTCPSSCAGLTLRGGNTQTVNSGGLATSTTLNGGFQTINSGGVASSTTINNFGQQGIFTGGAADTTTVNSGGGQFVLGGAATHTTVNNAGFQEVDSGTASGVTVNDFGAQYVSGGTVTSTTVTNGYQEIDGGTVTGTAVNSGSYQNVIGGSVDQSRINDSLQSVNAGTVTNTVVSGSAAEQDVSGGAVVGTTVVGGTQFVSSGGVASATTLEAGASQYVSSGGAVFGTAVSGGAQYVSSGGNAAGTTLLSAGIQSVYAGGTVTGTTINSGGLQNVFSGGVASATTVNGGGTQLVTSGGLVMGATVNSGGVQTVNSGGIISGTVVSTGGVQSVASGGVALGSVISSGGVQAVSSGGMVQPTAVRQGGAIMNNGTVIFAPTSTTTFDGSLTGSGAVSQQGAGTTIVTGDNHAFAGTTTVTSGTLMIGDIGNAGASLGGNVAVASAGALRGHGTVGGNVGNDGVLMPGGTIGTLTIGGNYTQNANGTLVIELSPTSASQLKVQGTAALSGGLQMVYDPGTYSARRYAILTANNVGGRFDRLSNVTQPGVDLSGLTPSLDYSASEVDLVLAPFAPPVTIAPLDTSIYTALASTAALGERAFDGALMGHLATSPTIDRAGKRDSAWATLMDGYARADGSGAASAFGAHRSGFAAGFDHEIGNGTVGGAIGYEHDEISESATPSTGKLDTLHFAIYGRRMFGPVEASGVFGYGFSWASEKRPLAPGPNGTPEGSNHLQSLSGSAQAGTPFEIGSHTVLEPHAGLHWAWLHGQGFAESGGNGQNLAVGADTVHSAQPYLGLSLMHAFGTMAEPVSVHVDVDYAYELANRNRSVTVFTQDGTAFAAPGAPLAHHIVSIGAGVRAQVRPSWSISGDASTQLRVGSMVHLQLDYRF